MPSKTPQIKELQQLPDHMLLQIFSKTLPEQLVIWRGTDKRFHNLLSDENFWAEKLQKHFPSYQKVTNQSAFDAFKDAYAREYKNMPETTKVLFSTVKENSADLDVRAISNNLMVTDGNGLKLIDWLAIKNNQTLLDKFYQNDNLKNKQRWAGGNEKFSQLQWAVYCQQPLQTVQEIMSQPEKYPNSEAQMNDALTTAAKRGNVDVIKSLYQFNGENKPKPNSVSKVLTAAAARGQREVLDYLVNPADKEYKPSENDLFEAAKEAARNGQTDTVKYLTDKYSAEKGKLDPHQYNELLQVAALYNRVNVVQHLLTEHSLKQEEVSKALITAARNNGVDTVEYLCTLPGDNKPGQKDIINALEYAYQSSSWENVIHLSRKLSTENNKLPQQDEIINEALFKAAQYGEWNVVQQVGRELGNKLTEEQINDILKSPEIKKAPTEIRNWLNNSKNTAYADLCHRNSDPLLKARALLNDYTKGDSTIMRALHGHLNRDDKNLRFAADLVKQIDKGEIKSGEMLLEKLKGFTPQNKTGSFARRTQYIQDEIFPGLVKQETPLAKTNFQNLKKSLHDYKDNHADKNQKVEDPVSKIRLGS